jgi:glycosyltransferase involved in cell wall biosynthesis
MMLKPLSQSNILIAGPARNISEFVAQDIQALLNSCINFKSAKALVIESDSSDDTVSVLDTLKQSNDQFDYITLGALAKKMPKRTERLAFARNRILDEVLNNPEYANIDFIAMADLDGINRHINAEKIEACWKLREPWDAITANQPDLYYDIWTLRHPDWSPGDCIAQKSKLESIIGKDAANNLAVKAKQVSLDPSRGVIEVDSAFGGLGIYKRAAFVAGRYVGLDVDREEVSDHISFHQDLKKAGYRIYINCALVNSDHHIDPPPPPPKAKSMNAIVFIQKIGLALFGKDRFNKYLDLLKKT